MKQLKFKHGPLTLLCTQTILPSTPSMFDHLEHGLTYYKDHGIFLYIDRLKYDWKKDNVVLLFTNILQMVP